MHDLKLYRKELRGEESLRQKQSEESLLSSQTFMYTEVDNSIQQLYKSFSTKPEEMSFDDLVNAKSNLPNLMRNMKSLSTMIKELLCIKNTKADERTNDNLTEKYHKFCALKERYVDKLHESIKVNEVKKQETFQSSKLNIKLQKFKGYDSTNDIYTFQSNFEKIHLKSTPKTLLPDVLKNNYLEGAALTLVKENNDIDDIWSRLKASYGDPKLLLSKKFSQLNQTSRL